MYCKQLFQSLIGILQTQFFSFIYISLLKYILDNFYNFQGKLLLIFYH